MDCLCAPFSCCFASARRAESNPIMDAEAKRRAAEAAEQRYAVRPPPQRTHISLTPRARAAQKFETSAHGKAAKRSDQLLAAERQRSREARGGPDLVSGWREGS